jgi:hypothetical protein
MWITMALPWYYYGIMRGNIVDYLQIFFSKIEYSKMIFMVPNEHSEKISKAIQTIEEFKIKHSDMGNELKRRLFILKKKNLRLFLKQAE